MIPIRPLAENRKHPKSPSSPMATRRMRPKNQKDLKFQKRPRHPMYRRTQRSPNWEPRNPVTPIHRRPTGSTLAPLTRDCQNYLSPRSRTTPLPVRS
jgi:hypothetical protein